MMAAISQLFVTFYTIIDYRDNRHLGDSTIVRFTIAIYRDNRQYRAPLVDWLRKCPLKSLQLRLERMGYCSNAAFTATLAHFRPSVAVFTAAIDLFIIF